MAWPAEAFETMEISEMNLSGTNETRGGLKKGLRVCLYCARYKGEEFNVRLLGVSYLAAYLLQKGIVVEGKLWIVDDYEEAIDF